MAGIPFVLNSAYRCQAHNDSLPNSTKDSAHVDGLAVDIAYKDNHQKFLILKALFATDFQRIGYSPKKKFIHADLDTDKPNETFWDY